MQGGREREIRQREIKKGGGGGTLVSQCPSFDIAAVCRDFILCVFLTGTKAEV